MTGILQFPADDLEQPSVAFVDLPGAFQALGGPRRGKRSRMGGPPAMQDQPIRAFTVRLPEEKTESTNQPLRRGDLRGVCSGQTSRYDRRAEYPRQMTAHLTAALLLPRARRAGP